MMIICIYVGCASWFNYHYSVNKKAITNENSYYALFPCNIAHFIDWTKPIDTFSVIPFGDNKIDSCFKNVPILSGKKTIKDKPFIIKTAYHFDSIGNCQILHIINRNQIDTILKIAEKKQVLTISHKKRYNFG